MKSGGPSASVSVSPPDIEGSESRPRRRPRPDDFSRAGAKTGTGGASSAVSAPSPSVSAPSSLPRLAASAAAACATVSSGCSLLRLRGDPGGEKVGDGDDGVGGSAVSFQSRCVPS